MRRDETTFWASVLAATLVVGLAGCGGGAETVAETDSEDRNVVRVTGELQSGNSHFYGPPSIDDIWNYTIAYMAPDGEPVGADQPILRFDTQELMIKLRDKNNALNEKRKELDKAGIVARETLAELSLAVEEAKANLDKARLKADIPANLLAARDYQENQLMLKNAELNLALRREELDKERIIQDTEVRILEREVAVRRSEVERLQASIGRMTISSPAAGVVIHVRDRRNNKMAVGDNVWGGRRVLEFPDLEQLEAHIEIPERESARIRQGQQVRFTMDAAPDRVFLGEIVELASVIHTRSSNQPDKVFDALVKLEDPDPDLMRPGMNINAEIVTGPASGASGT
ncbi:HlyD family efflux transporter periplasmic adaptor subunit [Marinihelvus fidelis]|uniref:HlyD family efflux transporter periplasmic adaptor subunit n=1 Tax=Marinihelvus fidelis TaxID=2613842 RepID=A0A5N0TAP8_9GAMM|nr:efflux RND transporter periplasmic adaptor subunit [Marinihelvus fidelis]KAA9131504.1 HlyD family efflux transporter periplasmic adaptor subunit [Marinihelvus fidelis]